MNTFLEKTWKEGKNIILVFVVGISALALCGTVFANGLLNSDFSDSSDAIDDGIGWEKFENRISFCSELSDKLCTTSDTVGEVTLEDEAYVSSGRDGFCGEAGVSQRFTVPKGAITLKFMAEAYTFCDGDHTILSEEVIHEEEELPGGIMGGIIYEDEITGEKEQDWLDMPGIVSCPILSNAGPKAINARVNNYAASSGGHGTIDGFYSMYPELLIQDIIGTRRADQRKLVEEAFPDTERTTTEGTTTEGTTTEGTTTEGTTTEGTTTEEITTGVARDVAVEVATEAVSEAVTKASGGVSAKDMYQAVDMTIMGTIGMMPVSSAVKSALIKSTSVLTSQQIYNFTVRQQGTVSSQASGDAFANFVSKSFGSGWTGNEDGSTTLDGSSLTIHPRTGSSSSSVSAQSVSGSGGGGFYSSSWSVFGGSSPSYSSGGGGSRPACGFSSVFSPGVKINNVWLKDFNPYAAESEGAAGDLLPLGEICVDNQECESGLCEEGACSPNENPAEIEGEVEAPEFGPDACHEKYWDSKSYEVDISQYAGKEVDLKVLVKGSSRKYCNLPDHKMWIRADNFEITSGPIVEIVTDKLIKNESNKIEIKVNDINGDLDPLGVFIAVNAGGVWKVGADTGGAESEAGEIMHCAGSAEEMTCYYRVTPDYTWGDAVVIYASAYDLAENWSGWSGNWKGVLIAEEFEGDEGDEGDEGEEGEGSGGVPPAVTITSGDLTMNLEAEITATITDADGDANENEVYLKVYSDDWQIGDDQVSKKMDCEGTGSELSCSYSVTPDTEWGTIAMISVGAWDQAGNTVGWGDQDIVRVEF